MTIANNGTRDQYTATGGQTIFPYTFEIFASGDLTVEQNGAVISAYTVSGVGNDSGGNVTLDTGAAAGDIITIYRDMDFERLNDYQNAGDFLASEVNDDYDRIWAALQQTETNTQAAIRPSPSDTALNSSNTELADIATRGGKALGFAPDGALSYLSSAVPNGDFTHVSTVAAMTALTGLAAGVDVIQTAEFSTGNGGGGTYGVVLTTSVTPNGQDIIQGVADTSISFELRDKNDIYINQLGATTSIDNTAIINRAIVIASVIRTPAGEYDFNDQINLDSNKRFIFEGGGSWNYTDNATENGIIGTSKSNIEFIDAIITGSGVASGFSNFHLTSCSNFLFDRCSISKSGSMALLMNACSEITVRDSNLSNNYFYGVEDRDGINNKYLNLTCDTNGNTGTNTSTGGRGVNLWRCTGCTISGGYYKNNTEYGIRLYSEAADLSSNTGHVISNAYFEDNTSADIVLYDESLTAGNLIKQSVVTNCVVIRTTAPSLGVSVLLQGGFNIISEISVFKTGAYDSTSIAFHLNNATECRMNSCRAENIAFPLAVTGSLDCTIEDFFGDGCTQALNAVTGQGIALKNSRFVHSASAGASDVAITNFNATGKNYYEGNILDGFHTGFYIDNEAVALFRNTTINSTFAGIRKDDNDLSSQEFGGNSWDSSSKPELLAMEKRTNVKATTQYTASPVNFTWAVGDTVRNSAPSVGNPKGWMCTVAGTPGTWVSTGNL